MRSRFAVLVLGSTMAWVFAACGGGGDTTGPDPAAPHVVSIPTANTRLDAIGATLQLTATVLDGSGHVIPNATPTWQSSDPSIASVNASGLVTSIANGTTQITAAVGSVQGHVTVTVAQVPDTIIAIAGDDQTGKVGEPLSAPLVVQVNDRLAHPVSGVTVVFSTASGNGSVAPPSATTGSDGRAQATWTLGTTAGPQRASAVVAGLDSAHFTATAEDVSGVPQITQVAPDTLVEGQAMTITGVNFSTIAANNLVTVDGLAASVTAATGTSLTVTVPSFPCRPTRLVTIQVQVGTRTATSTPVPLRPAAFTTLAVGEEVIIRDPAEFCFQFPARASGDEIYVMGLSAPAEVPGAILPFQITAEGGVTSSPMLAASFPGRSIRTPFSARRPVGAMRGRPMGVRTPSFEWMRARARAEARLRQWERQWLPTLAARRRNRAPVAASVGALGVSTTPAIGDTLTLRVPNFGAPDLCADYTTIRAVVRVIGSAGIWVEDVANPTDDPLTLADIQAASNQFDAQIYATDTTYFGSPSDIDGNGRIIIALTQAVNRTAGVLGFVFGGDLLSAENPVCPQSNGAEIYYGEVPDPANVVGSGARTRATVVARMPALIAHEFTHIIQNAQRFILHSGQSMASWEMEGQATFAEELVGHAVLGNMSGQNYGADIAFGVGGFDWYSDMIIKWAEYFGTDASDPTAAPDLCTVYGNVQMVLPCVTPAFYGASWIFQRYIADQYAPSYPGGLVQLTRDWVAKNVTLSGTANIGALLGVDYDSLFVRFATALALDDQPNATGTSWVPPEFRITSWDSGDIADFLTSCCSVHWFTPPIMGFASASTSRSVRGGSTAYTVLAASGHPAAAFRVTDPVGGTLSTALRPALWIVRIQ